MAVFNLMPGVIGAALYYSVMADALLSTTAANDDEKFVMEKAA